MLLVKSITRRHLTAIAAVLQGVRMQVRVVRLGRAHLLFTTRTVGAQYSQACNAVAVAHSVGCNQAVGARGTTRDVTVDSRAARDDTRVVRVVACYLAQSCKSNWAFLSTDRKTVASVGVATLVCQVVRSGGVTATNGTLLEMTLENVTARESIFTQVA